MLNGLLSSHGKSPSHGIGGASSETSFSKKEFAKTAEQSNT